MKLHDEDAERALAALSRPLKAHELADAVFPNRADRPITARKHSGHAIGRDLVERGWVVKNADGTYIAASLADPMVQSDETAQDPGELIVDEDGNAVRVRKEVLGPIEVPPPPQRPAPSQATVQHSAPHPYRYARPQPAPAQPQAPSYASSVQQPAPAPPWRPTEQQFIDWSVGELETFAALQDEQRWEEAEHHWQVYLLGARRWNVALGWAQPDPTIDRRLEAAVEASRPRYRPRPNGSSGRPWAQPRRHPSYGTSYGY